MKNAMNRFKLPLNLQLFAEDPTPDPDPNPEPTPEPPKLVPQDEVDRIVADRLARERKKYADYDDIKAKLADFEGKQAEWSTAKEAAEKRAQEAEEARTKALESANKRLVKAEFKELATTGDVKIRPDAIDDAFQLADISGVTVDESGNVVGMVDVIKALIEAKPYLASQSSGSRQIGGDTNGGTHKADLSGMTATQLIQQGMKQKQ
ncbi:phage scaffolding protein [Paenibacillus vini]|uniref:Uncharacterized protein n=1 Tax=Paenibacillus vini TaxID=1476024 RepID=A0ABQ4MIM7_9BACL|nr:scaffolding protein [Paenibacillus vini]GIP55255.1 hypothetical protein J42TS3_42900 [Paenibacillus vini]